jgi:dipeptidase E
MTMRLLLLSNGRQAGMAPLEHARAEIDEVLAGARTVAFLPYASVRREYEGYLDTVAPVLGGAARSVTGLHAAADAAAAALQTADAIAVGGGNTWQLLRMVREQGLLPVIRERVRAGVPFIGWSAGANLACPTIGTTNDMPITDPGGTDALRLIGWQINPHYVHGNPPGFEGETREERILEYLELHPDGIVTGLREGTMFRIDGQTVRYLGPETVRVFRHGQAPQELAAGADMSFLPIRPT